MLVKICGLTRAEDAVLADKLEADLLGIVFAKSPRKVTLKRAQEIVKAVGKPEKFVAVFVNEDVKEIVKICNQLGIHWVQLHGEESAEVSLELEEEGINVIKAVRVKTLADIESMTDFPAEALLFDNFSDLAEGGTGKTFDWSLLTRMRHLPRFFLSGGVSIDNIQKAHDEIHPSGVDLSSSLESEPGIKDPTKLKTFMDRVNHLRDV